MRFLIVIAISLLSSPYALSRSTEFSVEFLRNYDGDTISVNIPDLKGMDRGKKFSLFWDEIDVRLGGIDTPEIRGKCENEKALAQRAKDFVNRTLSGARVVTLDNIQKDKYFRILAEIYADGVPLAQMLMDEGLAVPYDGGTKANPWCASVKKRKNGGLDE